MSSVFYGTGLPHRALSLNKNAAVRVQTIPVPLTGVLITLVIRVPFHKRLQS